MSSVFIVFVVSTADIVMSLAVLTSGIYLITSSYRRDASAPQKLVYRDGEWYGCWGQTLELLTIEDCLRGFSRNSLRIWATTADQRQISLLVYRSQLADADWHRLLRSLWFSIGR